VYAVQRRLNNNLSFQLDMNLSHIFFTFSLARNNNSWFPMRIVQYKVIITTMHALSTVIVITTIAILRQTHLFSRIPLFKAPAAISAPAKKQSIFNFLKFCLTNKPVFLEKPAFSWLHTLQEINNDRIIPMRPLKTLFLLSSVALVRQLGNMLGTPSSGVYVNARQKDSPKGFSKSLVVYDGIDVPLSDRPISPLGIWWRQIRLNFVSNNTAQILRKEIEGGHQIKNDAEFEQFKDKLKLEKLKQKNEALEKEKKKREKQEQERSDAKSLAGRWKTFCQWISPYVGYVYKFLGAVAVATGVAGLINYVTAYSGNNRQDATNHSETALMKEYKSAIRDLITRNQLDNLRPVIRNHLDNVWNAHRNNPTEFLKELIWLSAGNLPFLNQLMRGHYETRRRTFNAIYPQELGEAINGYEVNYATNDSTVTSSLAVWLGGQRQNMITVLGDRIDASFRSLDYLIWDTHPEKINVESNPITDQAAQLAGTHSLRSAYDSTTPFSGLQNLDTFFDFKQPLTRIENEITGYLNEKIDYRDEIAGNYNEYTGLCQQSRQLMSQNGSMYAYEADGFELTETLQNMGTRLSNVQPYFQDSDLNEILAACESMQNLLNLRSSPELRRRVDESHNHRDQSDVEAARSSELNTETLRAASRTAYRPASISQAPSTPGSSVTRRNRGTKSMRI
jgi:hypothetical protein